MFLAAGLSLNQTGASLAGYSEEQQLATEAAQAGVDYAKTRLQEFPDWKGGTGDSVVVDMPGQLWVRENRGNVMGIVGEGDRKCAFRIRFNYQNGGGAPNESMPDPNPAMFIPSPYVSANNLNSSNQLKIYRSQSGGSWSVTPASASPFDCTRYSAVIYCEGLAGPGLRSMSPANLNPSQSNRRIVRRVAEVTMGRNLSQVGDAPIYGAQSITLDVANAGKVK